MTKSTSVKCLLALCLGVSAQAQANGGLDGAFSSHTVRTIKVDNPAQTDWIFAITPLTEQDRVVFRDADSAPIPPNTLIAVKDTFRYGFSFAEGADFDIVYAVTAIDRETPAQAQGNPKCVFLFTGLKPAVPENAASNFAGAACKLERDEQGNLMLILDKV